MSEPLVRLVPYRDYRARFYKRFGKLMGLHLNWDERWDDARMKLAQVRLGVVEYRTSETVTYSESNQETVNCEMRF